MKTLIHHLILSLTLLLFVFSPMPLRAAHASSSSSSSSSFSGSFRGGTISVQASARANSSASAFAFPGFGFGGGWGAWGSPAWWWGTQYYYPGYGYDFGQNYMWDMWSTPGVHPWRLPQTQFSLEHNQIRHFFPHAVKDHPPVPPNTYNDQDED